MDEAKLRSVAQQAAEKQQHDPGAVAVEQDGIFSEEEAAEGQVHEP